MFKRWVPVLLVVLLAPACTTKQKLMTLEGASKLAALGRKLMSERCNAVKDECIAAKDTSCKDVAKPEDCPACKKVDSCHAVEKKVYASVGTLQTVCDASGVLIKTGGTTADKGKALLAEALRRLEEIRAVLKAWGVNL